MEELLELIEKNDCKLTIRYEKEYDTFLLKIKKYTNNGEFEDYIHVYPEDIDSIVPGMIEQMINNIALDEEEAIKKKWI